MANPKHVKLGNCKILKDNFELGRSFDNGPCD
jgi:hypothetical protein